MSSLVDREETGRLGRAWSKWCRLWRLIDALGSIVMGGILAIFGVALLAAGVAGLLRGLVAEFGFGCAFAALFCGGGIYCVKSAVKELRYWRRAAR
jgi:hypothetical protein